MAITQERCEYVANNVLHNLINYHDSFYEAERFSGPSLHFHRRALGLEGNITVREKMELTYAALVSWGMHRMGIGGPKMKSFEDFVMSMEMLNSDIITLSTFHDPLALTNETWELIRSIFLGINIMKTNIKIVGHSKILTHFFPELLAPIDREYTFYHLGGSTYIPDNVDNQFNKFKTIHEFFYYRVLENQNFCQLADNWRNDQRYPWDTSRLKIIDNLVIGAVWMGRMDAGQ